MIQGKTNVKIRLAGNVECPVTPWMHPIYGDGMLVQSNDCDDPFSTTQDTCQSCMSTGSFSCYGNYWTTNDCVVKTGDFKARIGGSL